MNDTSATFDWVAGDLGRRSQMSRLEARGTLRLALKEAGLLPKTVALGPMLVVIERILPPLLAQRGVRESAEMSRALIASARAEASLDAPEGETPENVFSRFGGLTQSRLPAPRSGLHEDARR